MHLLNQKLLIVSAASFEVAPLVESLDFHKRQYDYVPTGIGPLNASATARELGEKAAGCHVVFMGTCGIFGGFDKISLRTSQNISWCPPCVRESVGELIEGVYPPFYGLPKGPLAAELPAVNVLCSSSIGNTGTLPQSVINSGHDPQGDRSRSDASPSQFVENLELYSCVGELLKSAESLSIVLCITNAVGPLGRQQWRENFIEASRLSAQYVMQHPFFLGARKL